MSNHSKPGIVSVHALQAGYLTLPERYFVAPLSDADAQKTVPSLAFLIQHQSSSCSRQLTRLVFDLGLRRDISLYAPEIQKHIETRRPISTSPSVVESLALGGLLPDDIDFVVLSHVHWDHIGLPSEFLISKFVVGNGSCGLLNGTRKLHNGSHSHFEAGLLPKDRTIELSDPDETVASPLSDRKNRNTSQVTQLKAKISLNFKNWRSIAMFPSAVDVFGDGSLQIVSAPGHLPGHLNLLCRTSLDPTKYVLLAADAYHDRRLLTGEKNIAEWVDPHMPERLCCIHADKQLAMQTLRRIRDAEKGESEILGKVEVVFAHDPVWDEKAKKEGRFWPGQM